jgi:large subunit ribosomal protein L21
MEVDEGGTVELARVLMLGDGDNVTIGQPLVEGARVMATVKQNGRGKKIIVFKYKAKVRYRRKNGHRQLQTTLSIDKILGPGEEAPAPPKKTRRRKKDTAEEKPETAEVKAEAAEEKVEAPEASVAAAESEAVETKPADEEKTDGA